jgi:hypothetical protein
MNDGTKHLHSRLVTRLALSLLALLFSISTGCDLGIDSGGSPSTCLEAGAQCVLGNGPLGVCERSQCSAGEEPPCFQCTPQH